MKNHLLIFVSLLLCHAISAQKASEILENGIPLREQEKLFIKLENNVLKFDATNSLQDPNNPPNFTTLDDSTIFLLRKNGLNIYLRPLNPLNYSYSTENKIITDPINESVSTAFDNLLVVLKPVSTTLSSRSRENVVPISEDPTVSKQIVKLQEKVETINKQLDEKNNQKTQIVDLFNKLKSLKFNDEIDTKTELVAISKEIAEIQKHFEYVDSLIKALRNEITTYNDKEPNPFLTQYVFNLVANNLNTSFLEQKKRLENLKIAYNKVLKVQEDASLGGGVDGLRWCIKMDEIRISKKELNNYTIQIKENPFGLSDSKEIITNSDSKGVTKKTIQIRRYQLFVPEVSTGIVFTSFKYNTYGTTSDSTGQQFVANPKRNDVKNINASVMINWNLFLPYSPVHPFIQFGGGINSEIPSVLLGGGLRFSNNAKNRLRFVAGYAMTWLRELDKLKVGDKVSGTAEIDKDLKYSGAPKFSPYFGLQYNF